MIRSLAWNRIRYTILAPVYDLAAGFGPQRRRSLALLSLKPGERVLIDGCGTGADLEHLPAGLKITAGDLTPAMVQRTRERAARLGMPIDARVMDAQDLPLPSASFDVVILHLILAVVPDPIAAIREAERVLRPGGRAIVLDKWVPAGRRPSVFRRAANLVTSVVATEITRSLEPLLAATTLQVEHSESAGLGGFFTLTLLRRTERE